MHSIKNTRYYHRLKNYRHSGDWITIDKAAEELGVSETVIRRLIKKNTLPATQVVATSPWIISCASLSLKQVQVEAAAVRQGRRLKVEDPRQQKLPLK